MFKVTNCPMSDAKINRKAFGETHFCPNEDYEFYQSTYGYDHNFSISVGDILATVMP
jgi:hypothetical protein